MPEYRIDFDGIEWQSPIPGVRQKSVIDAGTKLRLVEYTPDMAPHWCSVGHFGLILEGRFEIQFGNGSRVFEAGDGVMIPAGDEHRHRARPLTDVVRAVFLENV